MKKLASFLFIGLFVFSSSCKKDSVRIHVTIPITAGTVSNYYFLYHNYVNPIKIFEDTGLYRILDTDTHLPSLLLLKYPPNDENVITIAAMKTIHLGSRLPNVSDFSEVDVSGSPHASLCPVPLQKGDSISNSLNWVSSLVLTTNDTAYQHPFFDTATNSYVNALPYIKNLWTKKSYLATRIINSTDTTFGWIELQANEDSATVSIFKYGQQY